MAPLRSLLAATLFLLSTANAQFELLLPPSLEGNNVHKEIQTTGACGGGVPDLASNPTTDFHVDGDAVALSLDHPQATNVLMGATLNGHADGGWAQLFPVVQVSGGGNFCQPAVTAPREWAGKKGIMGIVCKDPDGTQRYQVSSQLLVLGRGGGDSVLLTLSQKCAAINFVSGANKAVSSLCRNGTGVSVRFANDSALSGLIPPPSNSSTSNSGASSLLSGSGLPVGSIAGLAVMVLAGTVLL